MVLIQRAEAVVLRVAVCGVGHLGAGGEVVDPVEGGGVGGGVEAAQEQVDGVGAAGAQGFGQFAADEGGCFVGWEGGAVAHGVELDVCLDVFGELDWASR